MDQRSISAGACVLFAAVLVFSVPTTYAQADPQQSEGFGSKYQEWLNRAKEREKELQEKAKQGKKVPYTGIHYYWDEGFHIVSRKENFRMKIGGKLLLDGGNIDADDELQTAFPDLDGSEADFRRLSVSVSGIIRPLSAVKGERIEKPVPSITDAVTPYARYDAVEFKFEIDFANVREIKDNWIRFPSIPLLGHFKFGHVKEPFSFETLSSINDLSFMERALPTQAFALGRNLGIRYDRAVLDERMTVGVGWFLNTGSFEDVGETTDKISEANGYNLTARVTGLPWYAGEGERLLHLGLSLSHGVRDDEDEDDRVRFRTRPESRLTDERLADTGDFLATRLNRINPELAIASGPLSFQGEYFHTFTDADDEGDPDFWGLYVFGSYFLTGEHRNYDRSRGVFSRLRPERNFHPLEGGWGALELGLRYSFIDLNDEAIKGGKERNFTAGLNWYLNPHSRFMFNYIYANVRDRAKRPAVDNGRVNIFQARFQIAF